MYPNASEHPILSLFSDTLAVPSPSGSEERLADVIRDILSGWDYHHTTDGAGNVSVCLEGRRADAPLCCIAAHMDEIGMVVTKIDADGSLRVDRSGGLFPWKLGEGPVDIIGDNETIVGVFSMGSTHVPNRTDAAITWEEVRVLTGHTPVQLSEFGVRAGSPVVPARHVRGPVLFGDPSDPLIGAWTFDDRMGVVALLRLLQILKQESLLPHRPTLVAFTVHEEGGGHGAKALAHHVKPETFISIDGCPIPPGSPLVLDGRPGIWSRDRYTTYDQRLLRDLCQAALDAGTELQPAVFASTASDASLVFSVGGAERIACFGHVRENSHGYEVARLAVFENVVKTLTQFATTWEG